MCAGAVYYTCSANMPYSPANTATRSELQKYIQLRLLLLLLSFLLLLLLSFLLLLLSQAINGQVEVTGPNECNVRDVKL